MLKNQRDPVNCFVEIIVLATMSAGKSTLINALLGTELMPSSNTACTAKVFRIEDIDTQKNFLTLCSTKRRWVRANPQKLTAENDNPQSSVVKIKGNVAGVNNHKAKLTLFDTPGPNNSRSEAHREVTQELLNSGNYGAVIYVMNATQFGINDDALLLAQLKQAEQNHRQKKKILFVLNKVDQLDEEKGETVEQAIQNAEDYLTAAGFSSPIIIPVSALNALQARKSLNSERLFRSDKAGLRFQLERLKTNRSEPENNEFSESAMNTVLNASGIKTLESHLDNIVQNKKQKA